ncbi:sulfatase-like hydrolase/transferase [Natrinema salsiterrestre]|uniref:Sulfatase-like hydrolase/transferase n=1 Tax=Natrinema salsiterrestre TaxID=2950540 RepID=A0A9Q4KWD1_9EURY|nr:sulfatase-like hydrolase/transferase [Natrinema salsiterrestre]MDF9743995.1 sulfatase-like hydrolase/transferase [Natrinema salsiterrestre]
MGEPLSSLDVSNVFVYVGDAVRWDHTPRSVLDRGLSSKSIAASTHSPTSFASLVTGLHPPRHGVDDFTNRLADETYRLFDVPGYETRFVNSVRDTPAGTDTDPIFSVLDVRPPAVDEPFRDIEEPFVLMERGPGGHAPYGDFDGSAWDYFERRGAQPASAYREEYARSVDRDAALFAERLEDLADRGLREDTLVVYTADHGELLGELGLLGHNGPMHPALVEVPAVFVHPDLSTGRLTNGVVRHVDLLPTVLDCLDESGGPTDGTSIASGPARDRGLSFYRSSLPTGPIAGFSGALAYDGVWELDGGHVFARTPTHERLAAVLGTLSKSPKRSYLRANLSKAIGAYAAGHRTYGRPSIDADDARTLVAETRRGESSGRQIELSEDQRTHLEDLGYLS